MSEKVINDAVEESWFGGGEEATPYLVNSLSQFFISFIIFSGPVSTGGERERGRETKKEQNICKILSALYNYPEDFNSWTSWTFIPKIKMFSGPISSLISTLAPSRVPIVRAPFAWKQKK